MSQVSNAMRHHHQELVDRLTAYTEAIASNSPKADPAGLVAFLKGDLLPHAAGEENHMYPVMDQLIKDHGKPTATMSVDHEFITAYVRQIEEVAKALSTASPSARPALEEQLRRLTLKLDGIFEVHLAKEERVYLPLFDKYLSAAEQQQVLVGMHEAHEAEPEQASAGLLDVRQIPPRERHSLIFRTFDGLQPGGAFVLVNDHDPKPLYYQLSAERSGQLAWDYLEQGPEVWRVRIGRTA